MKKPKYDIKYYHFLDGLRETGAVNMFGARPILAKQFKLDEKTSRAIHTDWMETFGDREEPNE